MELATIPWSRMDPGNPLARDYLTAPEKVLRLFAHDYRDPRGLRALAERQLARSRPDLLDVLVEYNRDVGGSAENARRLPGACCVVSGQQVGLLLGPAYTSYKLFTVIAAARSLEEELRLPVVPVFWVESEDHDWDEVNRFVWKDRRLRLEEAQGVGGPISAIEADAAAFLAEAREALGENDEAWALVAPERNVARWHVRNLARLVEGSGVVFVEPRLLREALRPLAERVAASNDALDASLRRDTGHPRRLDPPAGAYLFEVDAAGGRTRLPRGAPVPERWSTDVVSRVLLQNAAFPAVAAVCGPAEIQYWAQLKGAHEALDVPMPAVLPRNAATLVEKGVATDAARLGLDLEAVVRGEAGEAPAGAPDPVAARLRALLAEAQGLRQAVEAGRLDLPPNTDKPFRRTVERLGEDLEKLASRLEDARAEMEGAGRRRHERVLEALRPRGEPQERVHSLFPYLVRHGPGLARSLRESFDPFEFGHYLVLL